MRKFVVSFMVMFAVLVASAGCGSATGYPVQGAASNPASTQPIITGPGTFAHWEIGDRPVVSGGGSTLAVHLALIANGRVTVIFSLSGPSSAQPLDGKFVTFTNESGPLVDNCYPTLPAVTQPPPSYPVPTLATLPTSTPPPYPVATQTPEPPCIPSPIGSIVAPLAQLGPLQLGAVTYSPYVSGGRELHILVDLNKDSRPLDVFAAKVIGPPGVDPSYASSGEPYREGYLEQGGYRVSFNGYDFAKGDRVAEIAQANTATGVPVTDKPMSVMETEAAAASWTPQPPRPTSTIVPTDAVASQLAGGQHIRSQATLRIEDLASHQTQYLLVVFLDNGQVKATLVP